MDSLFTQLRTRLTPGRAKMPQGPREHVQLTNPWHAVSIIAGVQCCEAATKLAGRRYLARSSNAASERPPPLPVPGCDAAGCRCRYQHHADRRRAGKGRSPTGDTGKYPLRRSDDSPPQEAPAGR